MAAKKKARKAKPKKKAARRRAPRKRKPRPVVLAPAPEPTDHSADEEAADIMVLFSDPDLAVFVSAWPRCQRPCDLFDLDKAAEDIGVGPETAARLARRAIGLGLVYADGTIHGYALRFLNSRVLGEFKAAEKGSGK